MHVIIAYDISDNAVRTAVFKLLQGMGLNTQLSVFECDLGREKIGQLAQKLSEMLDPDTDSALIFPLCKRCSRSADIIGQGVRLVKSDWKII